MKTFDRKGLLKNKRSVFLTNTIKKSVTLLIIYIPLLATSYSPDGEVTHAYGETPSLTHSVCYPDMDGIISITAKQLDDQDNTKQGCTSLADGTNTKGYIQVSAKTINLSKQKISYADEMGVSRTTYVWDSEKNLDNGTDTLKIYCAPIVCDDESLSVASVDATA